MAGFHQMFINLHYLSIIWFIISSIHLRPDMIGISAGQSMSIEEIANKLVAAGKGILAADESTSTIAKRFYKAGIENTEENRRLYRELLFTTKGVENFISGVILFDETIRQSSADGTPFPKLLSSKGIAPGIKVDQGVVPFGDKDETITKGLEGLEDRLAEYASLGAQFTKWRGVVTIGSDIPTEECIRENAKLLAQFAIKTQEAGMVPIVEPEVLMDGAHTIDRCLQVTTETLTTVFEELKRAGVNLRGMLLKPNMIISGSENHTPSTIELISQMTIECFKKTVPTEVPGIVFLSGGQSDEQAAFNLNEMNKINNLPWQLSFSFGRGLQQAALKALDGKIEDEVYREAAKQAFYHSSQQCSLARSGKL